MRSLIRFIKALLLVTRNTLGVAIVFVNLTLLAANFSLFASNIVGDITSTVFRGATVATRAAAKTKVAQAALGNSKKALASSQKALASATADLKVSNNKLKTFKNGVKSFTPRVLRTAGSIAAKSVTTLPARSIPIAGAAASVGFTVWEITELCGMVGYVNELHDIVGIEYEDNVTNSFCTNINSTIKDLQSLGS